MKIQTISFCTGDGECQNHCPYCVARATGKDGLDNMPDNICIHKVQKILNLAELSGVSTALITSKGETLYKMGLEHTFQYIHVIKEFSKIPFIEVQTSGSGLDADTISNLGSAGVTTLAISCVSDSLSRNRKIFGQHYQDPFELTEHAHKAGMMVRLCCTMIAEYVESWESMEHMIQSCSMKGIEQLSFVPATVPDNMPVFHPVKEWIEEHGLVKERVDGLYTIVRQKGVKLLTLMHGGEVYDIDGVSVCIRYCLTDDPETNTLRQVIVYPNGEARYSWTSKAARLMRGDTYA